MEAANKTFTTSPVLRIISQPETVSAVDLAQLNQISSSATIRASSELCIECELLTKSEEDTTSSAEILAEDLVDFNTHTDTFNRPTYVCCSLVDSKYASLKCFNKHIRAISNRIIRDVPALDGNYMFELGAGTRVLPLHGLCILRKTKFELTENDLDLEDDKNVSEDNDDGHKQFSLKLNIITHDRRKGKWKTFMAEPIYSSPIMLWLDISTPRPQAPAPLKIYKSSRIYGTSAGGDEIILLTNYIDPATDDIQVEFFQPSDDGASGYKWHAIAPLDTLDIHGNCALVCSSPAYTLKSSNNTREKVYFRLMRPSTGDRSDTWPYYVCYSNIYNQFKIFFGSRILSNSPLFSAARASQRASQLPALLDKTASTDMQKYIDAQSQTDASSLSIVVKNSAESQTDLTELSPSSSAQQLLDLASTQKQLATCVDKMNRLVDRTRDALLAFSVNRSLPDFMRTHRYLLNSQDNEGNTPLHLAVLYGHFDLLDAFITAAATIPCANIINIKNNKQFTPLLIAAHLGENEACEYLLASHACPSSPDLFGNNVAHVACKTNNVFLLQIIIKYAHKHTDYSALNALNNEGFAPIHLAVKMNKFDLLNELVNCRHGVNINIHDTSHGYTALHYAVLRAKQFPLVNLLINHPDVRLNATSLVGAIPLHVAIANKNYMAVVTLVANGANKSAVSKVPLQLDPSADTYGLRAAHCLRDCTDRVFDKAPPAPTTTATSVSMLVTSIGKMVIDHVKQSEEIQRLFATEHEKCADMAKANYVNANLNERNITCDVYYYAKDDEWMRQILNATNSLPRVLFEKIICFGILLDRLLQPADTVAINNAKINQDGVITYLTKARDSIKEAIAQRAKLSQEATD